MFSNIVNNTIHNLIDFKSNRIDTLAEGEMIDSFFSDIQKVFEKAIEYPILFNELTKTSLGMENKINAEPSEQRDLQLLETFFRNESVKEFCEKSRETLSVKIQISDLSELDNSKRIEGLKKIELVEKYTYTIPKSTTSDTKVSTEIPPTISPNLFGKSYLVKLNFEDNLEYLPKKNDIIDGSAYPETINMAQDTGKNPYDTDETPDIAIAEKISTDSFSIFDINGMDIRSFLPIATDKTILNESKRVEIIQAPVENVSQNRNYDPLAYEDRIIISDAVESIPINLVEDINNKSNYQRVDVKVQLDNGNKMDFETSAPSLSPSTLSLEAMESPGIIIDVLPNHSDTMMNLFDRIPDRVLPSVTPDTGKNPYEADEMPDFERAEVFSTDSFSIFDINGMDIRSFLPLATDKTILNESERVEIIQAPVENVSQNRNYSPIDPLDYEDRIIISDAAESIPINLRKDINNKSNYQGIDIRAQLDNGNKMDFGTSAPSLSPSTLSLEAMESSGIIIDVLPNHSDTMMNLFDRIPDRVLPSVTPDTGKNPHEAGEMPDLERAEVFLTDSFSIFDINGMDIRSFLPLATDKTILNESERVEIIQAPVENVSQNRNYSPIDPLDYEDRIIISDAAESIPINLRKDINNKSNYQGIDIRAQLDNGNKMDFGTSAPSLSPSTLSLEAMESSGIIIDVLPNHSDTMMNLFDRIPDRVLPSVTPDTGKNPHEAGEMPDLERAEVFSTDSFSIFDTDNTGVRSSLPLVTDKPGLEENESVQIEFQPAAKTLSGLHENKNNAFTENHKDQNVIQYDLYKNSESIFIDDASNFLNTTSGDQNNTNFVDHAERAEKYNDLHYQEKGKSPVKKLDVTKRISLNESHFIDLKEDQRIESLLPKDHEDSQSLAFQTDFIEGGENEIFSRISLKEGSNGFTIIDSETDPEIKRNLEVGIINQIAKNAIVEFNAGKAEIKIQIKPKSMGQVKILLSSENDLMVAKISTETSYVKEILEQHMNLLMDELHTQGIDIHDVDVSVMKQEKEYNGTQSEGQRDTEKRTKIPYLLDPLQDELKEKDKMKYVAPKLFKDGNLDFYA